MLARGRRNALTLGSVVFLLLAASVVALSASLPAQAAPITPFGPRFQTNDTGSIVTVGNRLMTCPAADGRCAAALAGTQKLNNNSFAMTNLDVDTDSGTVNSSSADLRIETGNVLWAGLYWGARLSGGTAAGNSTANEKQMSFKLPGDTGYRTIASQAAFGPTSGDKAYQQFSDVTSLVRAVNPNSGSTYWGANVAAGTGEDRYAGWSLVVAYRDPAAPLRNLTVFDGFTDVGQGSPQAITIDGFLTPRSGTVDAQVGLVAYEGDFSATGDTAQLGTTLLGTTLSPSNNYFNGTNDSFGTSVQQRTPSDLNNLGFDIKAVGASGAIGNNVTSATINLDSKGDRYFPGVVTTAINLFAPDFSPSTKSVVNLSGHDPAQVGDVLAYTLNYSNIGQDAARNSVVTDPLPANTAYVPGSLEITAGPGQGALTDGTGDDRGEYTAASNSVRVRLGTGGSATQGGTIAVGAATSARFLATVQPAAAGSSVVNSADLNYIADTLNTPNTFRVPPVITPVAALADISVTKSVTPNPVLAGGTLTSTIVVSNAGPSPAVAATLQDALPLGLSVTSVTPAGGCTVTAQVGTVPGAVDCALGTLAPGASVPVTVVGQIPSGSTVPFVTNTASARSDTDDPNLANNGAGATARVLTGADLSITKSVSPATVSPGGLLTTTLTVRNDGPSDAAQVLISDIVDDAARQQVLQATATGGAGCITDGVRAQCGAVVLTPGATVTVTVVTVVASGLSAGVALTDRATVLSRTPDPDSSDNAATGQATTGPALSDLVLTKQVSAGSAVPGQQVTYTIGVQNLGPSDAAAVLITDTLPAGLTLVSATPSRGTCTGTLVLSCSLGTLLAGGRLPPDTTVQAPGASATITVVARVAADAVAGPLTNSATASSAGTDQNPTNNTASAPIAVTALADLSIQKTAAPIPAVAGEQIVYTLTVTNAGPSAATGVRITESLPAEFGYQPNPACDTPVAGELTCDVGDVPSGQTATVTITMLVPADFAGEDVTNTAAVSSDTPDPDPLNNSASFTSTAEPTADLSVTKTGDAAAVAGEQVSWTVVVTNNGPGAAVNAVLTDTLPAGISDVVVTPELCGPPAGTLSCALSDIPSGETVTVQITGTVDGDVAANTVLTNAAAATSDTPDPAGANNRDTTSTTVAAAADVIVQKSAELADPQTGAPIGPAVGPPGSLFLFTIQVDNDGPSVARDVQIIDAFDAQAGLVAVFIDGVPDADPQTGAPVLCGIVQGELSCPLGDVAPGQSRTVQFYAFVLSNSPEGVYINAVTASATTPEVNPADNRAEAPVTIEAPVAALALAKTSPDGETLTAGQSFSYRLEVSSLPGGSDAQGVSVTDTLPAGLLPTGAVASQGSCTISGQSVSCDLGTVPGFGSVVQLPNPYITITGTIGQAVSGPITNTATVASTTPESDDADNTATLSQTVIQQADLSVTKQADSEQFVAGGRASWSVLATNAGPSTAAGVVLTDVFPAGVAFDADASDPRCSENAGQVSCAVGTLAAGESGLITLVGKVPTTFPADSVSNTAAVSSSTPDPTPGDQSTVSTPVVRSADLVISKTAGSPSVGVGDSVTYTVTVLNNGPSDAENVVLTDSFAAGLGAVTATADPGVTCTVTTQVSCAAGTVPAGEQRTIEVVVPVPDGFPPGPLDNTAAVGSSTADADPTNNSATATVDVQVVADTSIDKTLAVAGPVVAGADVVYRLAVANQGPATAPSTTVSDTLPAGTTLVSAVPSSGNCLVTELEGNVIVSCDLGSLAAGGSGEVLLTVRLSSAAAGTLRNEASVGSGGLDPATGDNIDGIEAAITSSVPTSPTSTSGDVPPTTGPPTTGPPTTGPPTTGPPTTAPSATVTTAVFTTYWYVSDAAGGQSGQSAGQGSLSSTGVAVGGLIALATALLGLGLTLRIAGRRWPRRH